MAPPAVTFGLQVTPSSKQQWLETARRAEDLGFASLTVADHPGSCPSPFPALAAAAAVTRHVRLGPYVANAGLRQPLQLAADVATLDLLSDGRAFLGLGAGHSPPEWSMQGLTRPDATERVDRLIEVTTAVRALLTGQTVSWDGMFVTLVDATLDEPLPIQSQVPLLIGGNNSRLLDYAGRHADTVGLTGLGRTLADGHRHEARWSEPELDQSIGIVLRAAEGRTPQPQLQALVQRVEVADDPATAAERMAATLDVPVDLVLSSPFVLLGPLETMAERILYNRERWGITSYVVREDALTLAASLIEKLSNR